MIKFDILSSPRIWANEEPLLKKQSTIQHVRFAARLTYKAHATLKTSKCPQNTLLY